MLWELKSSILHDNFRTAKCISPLLEGMQANVGDTGPLVIVLQAAIYLLLACEVVNWILGQWNDCSLLYREKLVVVVAVKVKVVVVCKSFFFRDDKISDTFALVDRVGEQHRQQRDAQPAGREPQLRQPCLGYI